MLKIKKDSFFIVCSKKQKLICKNKSRYFGYNNLLLKIIVYIYPIFISIIRLVKNYYDKNPRVI